MQLAKERTLIDHVVHVVDRDNFSRPVCGRLPAWTKTPEFIDDLPIGCPVCRTFVADWLLGQAVSRDARQLVRDDIEWRHAQLRARNVPRNWNQGHGASEGDLTL